MLKYYFKIVYPLLTIALAVGAVMGLTFQLLEPILADAQKREEKIALRLVLPNASEFIEETYGKESYYRATGPDGKTAGYAIEIDQKGYGGPVSTLVGITNGAVEKVLVLEAEKETPGLGTRAKDPKWLAQFDGMTNGQLPNTRKDFLDSGLDSLTGATLTTMAVVNDIRDALKYYTILTNPGATNARFDNETGATIRPEPKKKKRAEE